MVHVVSCRYLRLGCSEEKHPLFRREYARSNRERGVKLLRCFPHCCPAHAQRSYCGCSVHLLVTFSGDAAALPLDELLVCTRFEPVRVAPLWSASLASLFRDAGAAGDDNSQRHESQRRLQLGERVALPAGLAAGQKGHKQFVWARADRESDTKQQMYPKDTVLYVINNHAFPEWFYSYDSSTASVQRDMTHHLVAYVFQLSEDRSDVRSDTSAVVLARHASAGFSLTSYRRSSSAASPGCELPAVESPTYNETQGESPEICCASSELQEEPDSEEVQQRQHVDSNEATPEEEASVLLHATPHDGDGCYDGWDGNYDDGSDGAVGVEDAGRAGVEDEGADSVLWRHQAYAREFGFREKGQHLLILWKFLQRVLLRDIVSSLNDISSCVHLYMKRAASTTSKTELENIAVSFLTDAFGCAFIPKACSPSPRRIGMTASMTRENVVVRVTVQLFLRALSSCTVERLITSSFLDARDKSSKVKLSDQFISLISSLYDVFSDMLRELAADSDDTLSGNQVSCLPALVDEVLSLVYGRTRFEDLQSEISTLVMWHQTPEKLWTAFDEVFEAFTAHMRETTVAFEARCREIMLPHAARLASRTPFESALSRRWMIQPESTQVFDIAPGAAHGHLHDLRILDFAQLIREFGCIDVSIEGSDPSLTVRSVFSFSDDEARSPMKLVLDGHLRVFHVLPSGVPAVVASTGGWSVGDYAGTLSGNEQFLNGDIFAFAEGYHPTSGIKVAVVRRVTLTLTLDQEPSSMAGPHPTQSPELPLLLVHAVVYGSIYKPPPASRSQSVSEASSADRSALWSDLKWTALSEMQAVYITAR